MKRMSWLFTGVLLAVSVGCQLLGGSEAHEHGGLESIPGIWAAMAALGALGIAGIALVMGGLFVRQKEDYYDER